MKSFLQLFAALSRRTPPIIDPPHREGWPEIPDTPQQRRRETDPRPWADVRPSDHTDTPRGTRR